MHDAAQCSKSAGARPFAVHEGVGGRVLGGEANGVLYKIVRTEQKSTESYLITHDKMIIGGQYEKSYAFGCNSHLDADAQPC